MDKRYRLYYIHYDELQGKGKHTSNSSIFSDSPKKAAVAFMTTFYKNQFPGGWMPGKDKTTTTYWQKSLKSMTRDMITDATTLAQKTNSLSNNGKSYLVMMDSSKFYIYVEE